MDLFDNDKKEKPNIFQAIAHGLSCFSLGFSIATLIAITLFK